VAAWNARAETSKKKIEVELWAGAPIRLIRSGPDVPRRFIALRVPVPLRFVQANLWPFF
jgi:hypothetical protein